MKNCTAVIINFLREPYLYNCVKSLRDVYPQINILVGENGEYTKEKKQIINKLGADYIEVSWDAGVCKGRNHLVNQVKTEYTLVGDDDFFYDKKANIREVVEFLKRHPEIDLVGGRVIEGEVIKNYQGFMDLTDGVLKYTKLELEDFDEDGIKYKKCDITFNFFVARTKVLQAIKWDENIKVAYEHSDYFLALKGYGATVVFSPDMLVVHKPIISEKINEEYKNFRCRKSDKRYFFKKHNLKYAIDLNGHKDIMINEEIKKVDFLIKTFERPECLEKLLFSIAKFYPDARTYIADDSKRFDKQKYLHLYAKLLEVGLKNKPVAFNLGYDVGLSRARNFLVENTYGAYKLLLDDDFIFTKDTDVIKFVETLDNNPDIGVVGGALRQEGKIRHYEGFLEHSGGTLRYKALKANEPLNYCDIIFNFALFRKEVFEIIKWDDDIKIQGEHTDFFLRLKELQTWIVAYLPEVVVDHEQIFNEDYKIMRARTQFLHKLFTKHSLDTLINFNGVILKKEGNDIIKSHI